jgi:hypothetical protein
VAWFFTVKSGPIDILRHVLVIAVLMGALFGVKWYTVGVAEQKAGDWLTSYNGVQTTEVVGPIKADQAQPINTTSPTLTAPDTSANLAQQQPQSLVSQAQPVGTPSPATGTNLGAQTPTPTPTPTVAEDKRLAAQLRSIRDRIKHHGDVMAYFYVNYFVAIVMVMISGLIVAVTLFFIAQGGWKTTSSYIETIFIVASMWTAFYGLFPPVFQQEKNITDNKALFLEYKGLESEVESFPITYLTLKSEPKSPREFINHVDAEMDRLGNIALGFDVNKINYQEAITLTKPTPANTTPTNNRSPTPPVKPGGR